MRISIGLVACGLSASCSAALDEGAPVASRTEHAAPEGDASGSRQPGALGFDQASAGALPPGWHTGGTRAADPPATWQVVADPTAPTPPNALALTSSTHGSDSAFNLCWSDALRFGDGALEVAFKAERGEEDQGGGPMWRVQDENNYYVCRMNPLESNFRVYYVKDGERKQLASARAEAATGTWHRIRVEHVGQHIVCTLDGATRLEVSDDHLSEPGAVGLWTKADAETAFDDLVIEPRR